MASKGEKLRAELYRFRAEELRKVAAGVGDPIVRAEFLSTAAGYDGLARALVGAAAVKEPASDQAAENAAAPIIKVG